MAPLLGLLGMGGGNSQVKDEGVMAWTDQGRFTWNPSGYSSAHWVSGHGPDKLFDNDASTVGKASNSNQPAAGFTWSAAGLDLGNGVLTCKTYGDGGNPQTITCVHSGGTDSAVQTSGEGIITVGTVGTIISIQTSRHDQGMWFAIYIDGSILVAP